MHHLADLFLHAAADGMSIQLDERSIHLGLVNCLLLLQSLSPSVIKRIEVLFLFHSMGNEVVLEVTRLVGLYVVGTKG
jgi:hypothetical protein